MFRHLSQTEKNEEKGENAGVWSWVNWTEIVHEHWALSVKFRILDVKRKHPKQILLHQLSKFDYEETGQLPINCFDRFKYKCNWITKHEIKYVIRRKKTQTSFCVVWFYSIGCWFSCIPIWRVVYTICAWIKLISRKSSLF